MDQAQLHQVRPIHSSENSYQKFKRFYALADSKKTLKILDVGCGSGVLDKILRDCGHKVIGLDIYAAPENKHPNFIECDINLPWPVDAQDFDYVICLDTAEHLYDPQKILDQAERVLNTDGKLIFGVPNAFDLRQRLRMLFGRGIVHWDNVKYQEEPWNYPHIRFFDFKSLLRMFSEKRWHPEFIQLNFQGGGIVPTKLTPPFFRRWLLKLWPALFSGKFIFGLAINPVRKTKFIYLAKTPKGL